MHIKGRIAHFVVDLWPRKNRSNKTDAKTTVVRTVKTRVPAFIAAAQVATARPAYVN